MLPTAAETALRPRDPDRAAGDHHVLLQPVVGRSRERQRGVTIADKDIAPQCVFRACGCGRAAPPQAQVAFDQAVFGLLVQIIGRGPVAARVVDVVDEVAADDVSRASRTNWRKSGHAHASRLQTTRAQGQNSKNQVIVPEARLFREAGLLHCRRDYFLLDVALLSRNSDGK